MQQHRSEHAGEQHLRHQEGAEAELPRRADRIAHMDQPGLGPALEPARALRQPYVEPGRSRLVGRARYGLGPVAETGQPQAKIGVLGDIVRVPSADLLQRRAAEMRCYVASAPSRRNGLVLNRLAFVEGGRDD